MFVPALWFIIKYRLKHYIHVVCRAASVTRVFLGRLATQGGKAPPWREHEKFLLNCGVATPSAAITNTGSTDKTDSRQYSLLFNYSDGRCWWRAFCLVKWRRRRSSDMIVGDEVRMGVRFKFQFSWPCRNGPRKGIRISMHFQDADCMNSCAERCFSFELKWIIMFWLCSMEMQGAWSCKWLGILIGIRLVIIY